MSQTSNYFFCYSPQMHDFLRSKGIRYITKAISIRDNQLFTLYYKDKDLIDAINEYERSK